MSQNFHSATHDLKNNVGNTERLVSLLSGTLLMLNGLKNRSILKSGAAAYLLYRGVTGHCPAYYALEKKRGSHKGSNINIKTILTINKPREEVYAFWRNLENLPKFMNHLQKVTNLDNEQSEWTAKVPGGLGTISWKSEIVKEETGERIGWSSLPGSAIENAGNVHFRDAGKFGTEIHVVISYHAPLGIPGEGVARLLNPLFEKVIREDIKNFKRYLETGEVPTIEGQSNGRKPWFI